MPANPDEQDHSSTSQLPPGIAAPQEIFEEDPVELLPSEEAVVKRLVQKCQQKDLAAWREEIIECWEMRLFDRGYQHLLRSKTQGWTLPAVGSGYHPTDAGSRSMFEANIFSSYEEMIVSALSREFPTTRFEPNDETSDVDITAAEAAEKLKTPIERNIGSKKLLLEIDRLLCTDGRVFCYTVYVKDAQRFGYEPEPEGVVPEDETTPPNTLGAEAPEGNSSEVGGTGDNPDNQAVSEGDAEGIQQEPKAASQKQPRGQETVTILGALESKAPMKANCIAECDYLQLSREIPISVAKAMFPDKATGITAASAGPGGDNIARMARVNVKLGVENNFMTSDSTAYDVTEQHTWLRPSQFYETDVPEAMRETFQQKFPNGMRVVYMGETFCEARNISMDDHLTLIHARSGDGMHRAALLKWLLPIQKVLNNLLDLMNDYFTRGIPMKWFPKGPFSAQGLKNQTNVPGGVDFYVPDPGMFPNGIRDAVFVEEILPFPEQLPLVLQWITGDLAQLLTGCFPALFGGDTGSNDTMGGIQVQRDQALGRLGPVWGRIKEGLSSVMRQAVQCLAKSGQDVIKTVGSESVRVETADLKGNVHCFPETDENFPRTQIEIGLKTDQLIQLAITNPMALQIVDDPANLELIKNATGIKGLVIPQLVSRDKQLGEIEILLKGFPQPNPKYVEAEQKIQEMKLSAPPTPEGQQMSQQLDQMLTSIPKQVSSFPVDPRPGVEDHDIESLTCQGKIRSPECREMKTGTMEDQQHYENLVLHMMEHDALKQKNQPQQQKPPNVSINLKDLPPNDAAAAALKAGLPGNAKDFQDQDIQQAAEKHPAMPIPVVPQTDKVQ